MTRNSLRTNQAFIISLMGVAAILLSLVTGNSYKQLTLKNQRANMHGLLEYKTQEEMHEQGKIISDLGLSLQHLADFRRAFDTGDTDTLVSLLNNQFAQYFVTADILDLEKLLVFDAQYQYITGSANGKRLDIYSDGNCQRVIDTARQRKGTDRLRVLNDICEDGKYPALMSIVPVGGLVPKGYIVIISRLSHIFKDIESDLGMPLQVHSADDHSLYRTGLWPESFDSDEYLEAVYSIRDNAGNIVASLHILDDMQGLKQQLETTRARIILVACGLTLAVMVIAFLILDRTVLRPVNNLLTQVQSIREDRTQLGQRIEVSGNTEIRQLAEGFNAMSEELGELYQSLEKMAFTDPLTHLYNRAWFHEQLNAYINIGKRHLHPFTVFVMDLNKFKPINDNHGHHVGDKVLEVVSTRMKNVLRAEDTLARLSTGTDSDSADNIIARMGGDEFAVLLPLIDNISHIEFIAHKLLDAIRQPIEIDSVRFHVDMSIGIAIYPLQGADGDRLLHKADEAMYHAKSQGGGYEFSHILMADKKAL